MKEKDKILDILDVLTNKIINNPETTDNQKMLCLNAISIIKQDVLAGFGQLDLWLNKK